MNERKEPSSQPVSATEVEKVTNESPLFGLRPRGNSTRLLSIFTESAISLDSPIHAETPLLTIDPSRDTPFQRLMEQFSALSSRDKKPFLLFPSYAGKYFKEVVTMEFRRYWSRMPSEIREVSSRFQSNALDARFFVLGSRFNHSCTPNVYTAWIELIRQQTFHAARNIKEDEELTMSYLNLFDLLQTKFERQRQLGNF